MKPIALTGLALVIAGIAALTIGHLSYSTDRKVIDLGPIKASVSEQHTVAIPDIAGFAAIIAGVALIFVSRRSA